MLAGRRVLLDTRFLGLGGAGRATSLLLQGLSSIKPSGEWILWGRRPPQELLWEGTTWTAGPPPMALLGQRGSRSMPSYDVAIYMHQVRPMRRGPSVTLIHDTIPLRHGSPALVRWLKRAYLMRIANLSDRILTVSNYSKRSIIRDLKVDEARIHVVRYPIDSEMVQRVSALRHSYAKEPIVLYVGRFGPHKNLERLLQAFSLTETRRSGGRLVLVGGSGEEVKGLRRRVSAGDSDAVQVLGGCSQGELEALYARASLLVMPSLEEGFGLPAWEALSFGLPVAVSDRGALPEVVAGSSRPFDAESIEDMAAAIDDNIGSPAPSVPKGPTVTEFARVFVRAAGESVHNPLRAG